LDGRLAYGSFWTNGCESVIFGRKKSFATAKSRFFRKWINGISALAKVKLAFF
jgi:hypothetical protein